MPVNEKATESKTHRIFIVRDSELLGDIHVECPIDTSPQSLVQFVVEIATKTYTSDLAYTSVWRIVENPMALSPHPRMTLEEMSEALAKRFNTTRIDVNAINRKTIPVMGRVDISGVENELIAIFRRQS